MIIKNNRLRKRKFYGGGNLSPIPQIRQDSFYAANNLVSNNGIQPTNWGNYGYADKNAFLKDINAKQIAEENVIDGMNKQKKSSINPAMAGAYGAGFQLTDKLISGNKQTKVGSSLVGIGGAVATVNPLIGGGLATLGTLYNLGFGNDAEAIKKYNTAIGNMAAYNVDGSTTQSVAAASAKLPTQVNVSRSKFGWFNGSDYRRYKRDMNTANQLANNQLTYATTLANKNITDNAMRNVAAFGGPLSMLDTGSSIGYELANRYLDNGLLKAQNKGIQNDNLPSVLALGGDMQSHGLDFPTGMIHIDKGGTHETNPYEGVPMGVDQEGTPNLVEEGETVYNDYVFSNRLTVPIKLTGKNKKFYAKGGKLHNEVTYEDKVLKRFEGMTYADAAKKAERDIMGEDYNGQTLVANKPLDVQGLEAVLQVLMDSQENEKEKERMQEIEGMLAQMTPEEQEMFMQQLMLQQQQDQQNDVQQMQQQYAMQENPAFMQQPVEQAAQQQAMVGAYGGRLGKVNKFAAGGRKFRLKTKNSDITLQLVRESNEDNADVSYIITDENGNELDPKMLQAVKSLLSSYNETIDGLYDELGDNRVNGYSGAAISIYNPNYDTKDKVNTQVSQSDNAGTPAIVEEGGEEQRSQIRQKRERRSTDTKSLAPFQKRNIAAVNDMYRKKYADLSSKAQWQMYLNDIRTAITTDHPISAQDLQIGSAPTGSKRKSKGKQLEQYAQQVMSDDFFNQYNLSELTRNSDGRYGRTYYVNGELVNNPTSLQVLSNAPQLVDNKYSNGEFDANNPGDFYSTSNGFYQYRPQGSRDWTTTGWYDNNGNWHDVPTGFGTSTGLGNTENTFKTSTDWFKNAGVNPRDYEASDEYINNYLDFIEDLHNGNTSALQRLYDIGQVSKGSNDQNRYFNDGVSRDNLTFNDIRNGVFGSFHPGLYNNGQQYYADKNGNLYLNGDNGAVKLNHTGLTRDDLANYTRARLNTYNGGTETTADDALWKAMFDGQVYQNHLQAKRGDAAVRRYALMGNDNQLIMDANGNPIYVEDPQGNPLYTVSDSPIGDIITDPNGTKVSTYGVRGGNQDLHLINNNGKYYPISPDDARNWGLSPVDDDPITGNMEDYITGYDGNTYVYKWDPSKIPARTDIQDDLGQYDDVRPYLDYKVGEPDPFPKVSNWPILAGLGLQGLLTGYNLLTGSDYSHAKDAELAAEKVGRYLPIGPKYIGNYQRKNPFDRNYESAKVMANSRAAARQLLNTSGGNRSTAMAGTIANEKNAILGIGEADRKAAEANRLDEIQANKFNRETDQFNAEAYLKAEMANQDAYSKAQHAYLQGKLAAAKMKYDVDRDKSNAISAGITGIGNMLYNYWLSNQNNRLIKWKLDHNYNPGLGSQEYSTTATSPYINPKRSYGGRLKKNRFDI